MAFSLTNGKLASSSIFNKLQNRLSMLERLTWYPRNRNWCQFRQRFHMASKAAPLSHSSLSLRCPSNLFRFIVRPFSSSSMPVLSLLTILLFSILFPFFSRCDFLVSKSLIHSISFSLLLNSFQNLRINYFLRRKKGKFRRHTHFSPPMAALGLSSSSFSSSSPYSPPPPPRSSLSSG